MNDNESSTQEKQFHFLLTYLTLVCTKAAKRCSLPLCPNPQNELFLLVAFNPATLPLDLGVEGQGYTFGSLIFHHSTHFILVIAVIALLKLSALSCLSFSKLYTRNKHVKHCFFWETKHFLMFLNVSALMQVQIRLYSSGLKGT